VSAYTDLIDAAYDASGPLRKQITRAILQAAADVANEPATTQFHAIRLDWSRRVRLGGLHTAAEMAARFVIVVLENPTIAANPAGALDSDVQFVVNALVNSFMQQG
jgi:hypothetical protein